MDTPRTAAPESARTQARREQVLAAAADCFCRHGFHAASMAEIAKLASISPGHIYNLFESKEAIIEAIVQRDLDEGMLILDGFAQQSDPLRAMVDHMAETFAMWLAPGKSELRLEVIVQAPRNAAVRELVSRSDARARAKMREILVRGFLHRQRTLSDEEIEQKLVLVLAFFDGVMIRHMRNPDTSIEVLQQAYVHSLRCILDA